MPRKLLLVLLGAAGFLLMLGSRPSVVLAEPDVYASPVHAGCYLMKHDRCKIHVEPFAINLVSGQKLVRFQLVANRVGGPSTTIYDFRPDVSNTLPVSGSTFTPSQVAKDFAATCGATYSINLQGQDTGDAGLYNLGTTAQFTCPAGTYFQFMPVTLK